MIRARFFLNFYINVFLSTLLLASPAYSQTKPWVTAYYGGWEQGTADNGYLPTKDVDFTAMTVVAHMALSLTSTGTLDSLGNGITEINSADLISAAHKVGTKVIITVGGWFTESRFYSSTSQTYFNTFVNNIVNFVKERGYDGVDIDWEPLADADTTHFKKLVLALRAALPSPQYLLTSTTAYGEPYGVFAELQNNLDQINIMTYDLSGPWQGWVTWYNSAVYQNGVTFPSTGGAVPACDDAIKHFINAGVAPSKLGIGCELGGTVWQGGYIINGAGDTTFTGHGATGPDQEWKDYSSSIATPYTPKVTADVPLYSFDGKTGIMRQYYSPSRYHWDPGSEAAYLSIDSTSPSGDYFITYDDSASIAAKFAFIKQEHLGGLIIYELGMGYPGNGTFPLLQSIKQDMATDFSVAPPDNIPPTISITSPSAGDTVSGPVTLTANASDNVGVTGVIFAVDQKQVGVVSVFSPFSANLNTTALPNGPHTISATAVDRGGNHATASTQIVVRNVGPIVARLLQNYPNPFNPTTKIQFVLNKEERATLTVYNVLGEKVATLFDGVASAGTHVVKWNAAAYASGAYLYVLVTSSGVMHGEMMLIK